MWERTATARQQRSINATTTKRKKENTRGEKKSIKKITIPNLGILHMFNILIISHWCLHLLRYVFGFYETLRDNIVHFSGKVMNLCRRTVGNDHKLLSRYRHWAAAMCIFFFLSFFLFISDEIFRSVSFAIEAESSFSLTLSRSSLSSLLWSCFLLLEKKKKILLKKKISEWIFSFLLISHSNA